MVLWHGSVGLPLFSGTAIASSLMDRQGRKSLLITSFTGMVVSYYSIQKYCICLRTFYLCIVLIGYELTINVVSFTSNGCALWFFRFMFLVALWNTNVAEVTLILNFIITDSILLDSGFLRLLQCCFFPCPSLGRFWHHILAPSLFLAQCCKLILLLMKLLVLLYHHLISKKSELKFRLYQTAMCCHFHWVLAQFLHFFFQRYLPPESERRQLHCPWACTG